MNFFSKTIIERAEIGQIQRVIEKDYAIHIIKDTNLPVSVISDEEYPMRVAFDLVRKVIDNPVNLDKYLENYQDPTNIDKIMSIQKDLDETKEILNASIDSVLKRGEALDSLIQRSEDLSANSKLFYNKSKKLNSCCILL
jgi:synaptobrevin family protein YKT6